MPRLSIILFLLLATVFRVPSHAEEAATPTREELDARIAELESALIAAQARHFQAKHQRAYGDTNLAPVRTASRHAEVGIISLRRSLDERVRILDAEVREQQSAIAGQRKELADLTQLAAAIDREIAAAGLLPESDALVATLKSEREQAFTQRETLAAAITIAEQELAERTRAVIDADPEASALREQLEAQEKAFAGSDQALHAVLDTDEAVAALNEERQSLAAELQRLRAERDRLPPAP